MRLDKVLVEESDDFLQKVMILLVFKASEKLAFRESDFEELRPVKDVTGHISSSISANSCRQRRPLGVIS
jgi:hypothetical protein